MKGAVIVAIVAKVVIVANGFSAAGTVGFDYCGDFFQAIMTIW